MLVLTSNVSVALRRPNQHWESCRNQLQCQLKTGVVLDRFRLNRGCEGGFFKGKVQCLELDSTMCDVALAGCCSAACDRHLDTLYAFRTYSLRAALPAHGRPKHSASCSLSSTESHSTRYLAHPDLHCHTNPVFTSRAGDPLHRCAFGILRGTVPGYKLILSY